MKKIIIFGSIFLSLLILLGLITNLQNKQASEDNPYKKSTLHPDTINQLNDPNYQNIILPEELKTIIANKESAFVYFYSPTCGYCKTTTPIIVPLAEEVGANLQMYNVLEFEEGWDDYQISGTPTTIYFENGQEVARIEGGILPENVENVKQWFLDNMK